jgi:hypothetical protein
LKKKKNRYEKEKIPNNLEMFVSSLRGNQSKTELNMPQLINPNDIHTAAATWSGFIYQGKIALYHVLKLLTTDTTSNAYHLQLDSLEDFAIVKEDLTPISLHQVKAMKSTSYGEYKEAFDKLEKRKVEHPSNDAYFHLAQKNTKTAVQIKALHPTIDIYKYNNGNHHCSLDEVNTYIENYISEYLNTNNLGHFNNPINVSIFRNNLEALIFNQVIAIHANNHQKDGLTINEGAYNFTIPLINFISELVKDPATTLDENYYLFVTKELLNQYYTEFIIEIEEEATEKGQIILENTKIKLDKYLQQINSLTNDEIINFIKGIMPHRQFKLKTLKDFKDNNVPKEEFKYAFLQCLYELVISHKTINQGILWNDKASLSYCPTIITDAHPNLWRVCHNIYKNVLDIDYELAYQGNTLITLGLETPSIVHTLNKTADVSGVPDKKNNISKWANTALTTIQNAKKNVNENNN